MEQIFDINVLREFLSSKQRMTPIRHYLKYLTERHELGIFGDGQAYEVKEAGITETDRFKYAWHRPNPRLSHNCTLYVAGYLFNVPVIISFNLEQEQVVVECQDKSCCNTEVKAEDMPWVIAVLTRPSDICLKVLEGFWPIRFNDMFPEPDSICQGCHYNSFMREVVCAIVPDRPVGLQDCVHFAPIKE